MIEDDFRYYQRRAAEEKAAAERAAHWAAARAHQLMAEQYSEMANGDPSQREMS